MTEELISVIDVARKFGMHKQTVFKVIKRLGIETTKQRNPEHRNQRIAYIKKVDLEIIVRDGTVGPGRDESKEKISNWKSDHGVFYLIQLEPTHDPGRYKVGFAANMLERLRAHRCSAPFAKVLETWPCHRLWEKTAIDSVTQNCERLHTEVFRADNIEMVKKNCDKFFALMPSFGEEADAEDYVEENAEG